MAQFSRLPTKTRLEQPAEAESVFKEWADKNGVFWSRLGFESPPFSHFPYIPAPLRKAPDFVGEHSRKFDHLKNKKGYKSRHALIEVKGLGKAQTLKLKSEDIEELIKWQKFTATPITYFVWDSFRRRATIKLSLNTAIELTKNAEQGYFEDGPKKKMYYIIEADNPMIEWTPFEPTLEA